MMKLRKLIALLSALVMLCSLLPLGSMSVMAEVVEAMTNGDLETGNTSGYASVNGTSISSAKAHGGKYSLKATNTSLNYSTLVKSNPIDVLPNTEYTASVWYYYVGAHAEPSFSVYIKDRSNSTNVASTTVKPSVSATWTKVSVTFNTGSNESLLFLVQNRTPSDGGFYYFDDLSMTYDPSSGEDPGDEPGDDPEEDPAQSERFTNGDFELGTTAGVAPVNGTSITSDKSHGGSYALKATNTGKLWATLVKSNGISVKPNSQYVASFWYYCDSDVESPAFFLYVKDGGNSKNLTDVTIEPAVKGQWTQVTKTFNSGDNETILFLLQNKAAADSPTATYYFDDLSIIGPDPSYVDEVEEGKKDVPGNLLKNGTFETGDNTDWTVQQGSTVTADAKLRGEFGIKLTGAGNQGIMASQTVAVEAGKTYVVSAQMKAIANGATLRIKDGSASGTTLAEGWFDKTNWTRISHTVTPTTDSLYLEFCSSDKGTADTVYMDDVAVVELYDDGYLVNGDFEVGQVDPWTVYQGTTVSTEAAYNGMYGMHLKGNGSWNTIAYQDVTTVAGQRYFFNARFKADANGINIQIKDMVNDGSVIKSKWYNNGSWTKVSIEFKAASTTTRINISGAGNNISESVYMDDVSFFEMREPSYDGFLYNGDFETGTLAEYVSYQSTEVSTEYAYSGKYGCRASGVGNWGATLYQDVVVDPGKTYKISFWYKVVSTGMNFSVGDTKDDNNLIAEYLNGKTEWTKFEGEFQAGYLERVRVKFHCTGKGTMDELWVDDILLECLSGDEMDRQDNLESTGVSIRDTNDGNAGLAFSFNLNTVGTQVRNNYELVPNSGTVKLYQYSSIVGNLLEAGAVVSNLKDPKDLTLDSVDGKNTIAIPAKYVLDHTDDHISYAVRIINIPSHSSNCEIYARPYYTYMIDGKTVTIYGDMVHGNYDAVNTERTRMRVLTIGGDDSYNEVNGTLFDVLKSAGYDQVILGNLSLDTGHSTALREYAPAFTYYKDRDKGSFKTTTGVVGMAAITEEDWDVIVVDLPDATDEERTSVVNWVRSNQPDVETRVLMRNSAQLNKTNGVIATDIAAKNLATVLKDSALTDAHLEFTTSLTWYLALTGKSLDMVDFCPDGLNGQLFNMGRAAAHAIALPTQVTDLTETLILAGSDYQPGNWKDGPPIVQGLIDSTMANGTTLFDAFFCGGDYASKTGHDESTKGITDLDNVISNVVYGNKLYVEGNHDAPTVGLISPYGNNDPEGGPYGAFVINEEQYGAYGSNSEKPAEDLTAYLNEKIGNKSWGNKPIFVLSHVPLHYSRRTAEQGCSAGANPLIDALNAGGKAGLNIIFLFAHNHGSGHDDHLGGGAVYLKKGDQMLVCGPGGMNNAPATKTLSFTYMNYGYINNYADHGANADTSLTMTTFRIRADGAVIITRYSKNGVHNLKSSGVKNVMDSDWVQVNTTVYESSRIVTATDDQPYTE